MESALSPRASMVLRDPPHLKHAACYRYRRFLLPFFEKAGGQTPEVMAIVRHPVDWLGSWYRYRTRPDLQGHENSTMGISFDDFVREYCKARPASFAKVGSQARFLTQKDGTAGVDHLFRYEAQQAMLDFLAARLGSPVNLDQVNVSPVMETALSPDAETLLRETHGAEFAIWESGRT